MTSDEYKQIATIMPMVSVIDGYMSAVRNALQDASNQAENGSQLGMAIAIGRASTVFDDLFNAWISIKE